MRCFGFGILNYRMWTAKSGKGLSIKSLELYTLTFITRLLSILWLQGCLPFDKSGDWFYHFVEIFSLVLVLLALYGMFGPLLPTYDEKNDKFGNLSIPSEFGIIYIVAPCVILAVLFHPALNREAFSDTCWTLSMYLEALAMLPQVYMFQRQASGEGGGVAEVCLLLHACCMHDDPVHKNTCFSFVLFVTHPRLLACLLVLISYRKWSVIQCSRSPLRECLSWSSGLGLSRNCQT